MYDSILNFPQQFHFTPEIRHRENLPTGKFNKFILAGMGGSHLAGGLINVLWPETDLWIHRDYGLPHIPENEREQTLIIVSSYSGNTEEVLDCLTRSQEAGLAVAIVSAGGKLLDYARENNIPHIVLPTNNTQPRLAVGYSLISILKIINSENATVELARLANSLYPLNYEQTGKELADKINGSIPLFYTSARNKPLGYNWKININETSKYPAFYNAFPELNHNEIEGLSDQFKIFMITDENDHPRIQKRMEATKKVLEKRGLVCETITLEKTDYPFWVFANLLLAYWTSFHLAQLLNKDPNTVPLIEEFKKTLTS